MLYELEPTPDAGSVSLHLSYVFFNLNRGVTVQPTPEFTGDRGFPNDTIASYEADTPSFNVSHIHATTEDQSARKGKIRTVDSVNQ